MGCDKSKVDEILEPVESEGDRGPTPAELEARRLRREAEEAARLAREQEEAASV